MKKIIIIALLALSAVAGFGGWYYSADKHGTTFRTTKVARGDLQATISATGTIEPEEVVDVGAQVNGPIIGFGADPRSEADSRFRGKLIDYGSPVHRGTVLAQIDPSTYQAQVDQWKATVEQNKAMVQSAEAQVAADKANIAVAKANVDQMGAKANQSEADLKRAEQMLPRGGIAQADYDASKSVYLTNNANVTSAKAAVSQAEAMQKLDEAKVSTAKAALVTAEAQLKNAQINLGYCTVKSPVEGVIVDRRVNIGQTVVSSLNAPSLFLIAKDLKRLQVWASVNEADIGNVRVDQPVTFSVDAFAGQQFKGRVSQTRLNASMTQNVVTYTVVVETDNADQKLLPYLTANLTFEVDRHQNSLKVPNAALRWKPNPQLVVPDQRQDFISSQRLSKAQDASGVPAPAAPDKEPTTKASSGRKKARMSGRSRWKSV